MSQTRSNYITVPIWKSENNYNAWKNAYFFELNTMYEKTCDILYDHFPNLNIDDLYDKFCKMIYNSSSGEISPYLDFTN